METIVRESAAKDTRIAALETAIDEKNVQIQNLIERVNITQERSIGEGVRNQPFAIQCGWKSAWTYSHSTITYDRLYYDNTSGGPVTNGTMYGGLDINTGVFTVGPGFSGVWTVSYSLLSLRSTANAG